MCDPLSIGSAVLSIGGMVAQAAGNADAAKARDSAVAWENAQQARIQQQAKTAFDNTEASFSPKSQTDQQNAYAATRNDAITGAMAPPASGTSAGAPDAGQRKGAPTVVGNALANANAGSNAIAAGEGGALAKEGSLADLFTGNKININRGSDIQNKLTSFSMGDENLLPLMLQDANNKGAGLRSFGGLLSGLGSLGGLAGARGGGPTWGSILPDTTGDNIWTRIFGRSVPQQIA